MESISGTSDIVNLCDNLFIIHRVGRDFKSKAADFLGADVVSRYTDFSSVVEICKNRSNGVKDALIGMYYEKESRRLKNFKSEHIIYGWEQTDIEPTLNLPVITEEKEITIDHHEPETELSDKEYYAKVYDEQFESMTPHFFKPLNESDLPF